MIYIKSKGSSYNRISLVKLFIKEKPATYSDAECTVLQCREGAYRSVTELLEIVQTYFPKTTLEGLLKIIMKVIEQNKNVELIWCTQVKKVVLKYNTNSGLQKEQFITKYSLDRYKDTKGDDGYSISDYLKIINKLKKEN